jgi:putative membrane protein
MDPAIFPPLNASLNGLATLLLAVGFVLIKQGKKEAHAKCMISAFIVSCVFLVFYVLHKILVKGVHTPFGGEGAIRTVYYVMLITHVILAMAIVPLILMTMSRALKQRFELHKKIARITWPLWMYVSVTGVLVYFFLYQWFPAK